MGQEGGCCGGADMKKDQQAGGACCQVEGEGPKAGASCDSKSKSGGCGSGGCACGGKCVCASKPFACNVGPVDRVVRVAIGLALISLVFVGPQTPLGWVGILLILSAVMGYCGMYRMFGMSTYKRVCCGKCKTA